MASQANLLKVSHRFAVGKRDDISYFRSGLLRTPQLNLQPTCVDKPNSFSSRNGSSYCIQPTPNLIEDEVHVRATYASSLEPFFKTSKTRANSCKKYLNTFKKSVFNVKLSESQALRWEENGERLTMEKIANFKDNGKDGIVGVTDATRPIVMELCANMSRRYVEASFKKTIEKICALGHNNKNAHANKNAQANFSWRNSETSFLIDEAQVIMDQCYSIGLASGTCDAMATIDFIVGSETKNPRVYNFKSALERNKIKREGGKTSFNKRLPFKVQTETQYISGAKERLDQAMEFWNELFKIIEELIVDATVAMKDEEFDKFRLSQDQSSHGLSDWGITKFRIFEAMVVTLELGYYVGFHAGQKRYKEQTELTHDPWVYTYVDIESQEGVYISTKQGLDCGSKRGSDNDPDGPRRVRFKKCTW